MSFVSSPFVLLLATVLLLLAAIPSQLGRRLIVLGASCAFYAYWDWRFLGLLALVTVLDFVIARRIAASPSGRARRWLLVASLTVNLGILGIFKYADFFIGTLNAALSPLGWDLRTLNIILPIGISFYTFETLSYVIDVYRGDAQPTTSLLDYAIFVTFFPRLVAGPIMRARQFLPQLKRGIYIVPANLWLGLQIFMRGAFKKLVIADNMAFIADRIYAAPGIFAPATVWLGVLAYSIQIFCDFSGYSDMAIGVGRMLGFQLPMNFDLPYTAQSVSEFWQRWHISLSTWLRDYVYISLGGNRSGKLRTYVNMMITMLLGGLWHGASWNFVLWGGLHGCYLVAERAAHGGKRPAPGTWRAPATWMMATVTFLLVSVTWVFFRSPSLGAAVTVLAKLAFLAPGGFAWFSLPAAFVILGIVVGGFVFRAARLGLPLVSLRKSYAPALMLFQMMMIFFLRPISSSPFIYFQF